MAAANVRTERFLLRWKSIEPTQGSFHWAQRNRFIGQLASHGIRPVPFVWGSPDWVGSGALAQPPLNSAADQAAWRDFLQQAVARYGPGGTYWSNTYRRQYGTSAKPMPIHSWQIWNEPNLKKFFTPGENVDASARKYAQLLQISHDAITSEDPKAEIVFAGMPGYGDSKAWVFLDHVYDVAGVKERLRRHRPAPLRAQHRRVSPRGLAVPRFDDRATTTGARRFGSRSSPGDRALRTNSATTWGSPANSNCSTTPSS